MMTTIGLVLTILGIWKGFFIQIGNEDDNSCFSWKVTGVEKYLQNNDINLF